MANLLGQNIGTNYKGILNLNTLNGNLSGTLQAVTDGDGNASPLQLSTTQVNVGGGTALGRLVVRGDGTNPIAMFYHSDGSSYIRFAYTGGIMRQDWTNGSYFESSSSVTNWYTASIATHYVTWSSLGSAYTLFPVNNISPTSGSHSIASYLGTFASAAGSANVRYATYSYTINNSGAQTGNATGIFLNATETALNGMTHNLMDLQVGGVSRFKISVTDATVTTSYNISAAVFLGNSAALAGTGGVKVGNSRIRSDADANLTLLNDAANNFSLLKFGGTTSAFPAIKRNGTGIDFRLADDSAFCSISINSLDAANNLQLGATGNIRFAGITKIQSPSAGVITLGNDGVTDFNRLQFGGTSASFPAIKRNAAALEVRVADDSGFAALQASQFTSNLLVGTTSGRMDIRGQYDISIAGGFTGGLGGVSINQGSSATPNATAILDVSSTTKGFLPPRMTTAQRDLIATPAAGLVIYNTSTNVLNFYNGTAWAAV